MNAFIRSAMSIRITAPTLPQPETGHHETADQYSDVLFLNSDGRLRIIADKHHLQWIVQTRRPKGRNHRYPWKARGFCTTKAGLAQVLRHLRLLPAAIKDALAGFPERIAKGT